MKSNIFIIGILLVCSIIQPLAAQNTAITSGVIGKCGVWNYPYTLYNNGGAYQTINDGVTVTVDQNRNIGAVNYSGSGGMNFAGGNGITMSGAGGEINCRWDIGTGSSSTIVNNDGNPNTYGGGVRDLGVFFGAPYSGNYIWQRKVGAGWAANVSGAHLNAVIYLRLDPSDISRTVFGQKQPGSCGNAPGPQPYLSPIWSNSFGFSLNAGQTLSYRAGTAYNDAPGCTNTTFNLTVGPVTMLYDN